MYIFESIDRVSKENAIAELWKILYKYISYLNKSDKAVVELAFTQMIIAHGEQRRKSGEFYFVHPVATCVILADIHLDTSTLVAALLHDVPEDTTVTLSDLKNDFGNEIAMLVEGVTKYSTLKYRGEKRYAENLRKLFLAMNKDIRIVLIKLADRLHNLQTLVHLRPDKRERIAVESLEIYAPIAERLGISRLRAQIEDLAFPYVYPEHYEQFLSAERVELDKRKTELNTITKQVETRLKKSQIPYYSVRGRAKTYYSIYRKLASKERTLDQVYDLIAIRVVTYKPEQCYLILSLLHEMFTPLPERIKDYIETPKENGYKSIHTTVKDKHGMIFEIQIRTREMDEYAEYGVATHWAYKEGTSVGDNPKKFKWIAELVSLGKQWNWQRDYIRRVKMNLYADRIFVLTPKGDVVDLKAGATALDFAFKIHEKIGQQAVVAKINGRSTRLQDKLSNGDIIEIITRKNQQPTQDWLSKVTTSNALKKIRGFLNGATKAAEESQAVSKK